MASLTSFDEQYEALRHGSGVVELTDWSSVTVTGADRQRFLHNFCTNDVKSLVPNGQCEAFFTNAKGKIVAHGVICCRENELLFVGAPNQAPRLIEHLDRYIIREDVQLRDTTVNRVFLLLAGGGTNIRELLEGDELGCSGLSSVEGCISWNLTGSEFSGLAERSRLEAPIVAATLADCGWVKVDWQAFDAARIEAGVSLFGVDFDENNFPQEVGRDREAISFTKGCYLGQETVARIDALGHVNRQFVGMRFSGANVPVTGTELTKNGSIVGHVTSAAYSPQLRSPLALALVRREANAPGTLLESAVGNGEVTSLPLKTAGP